MMQKDKIYVTACSSHYTAELYLRVMICNDSPTVPNALVYTDC